MVSYSNLLIIVRSSDVVGRSDGEFTQGGIDRKICVVAMSHLSFTPLGQIFAAFIDATKSELTGVIDTDMSHSVVSLTLLSQ